MSCTPYHRYRISAETKVADVRRGLLYPPSRQSQTRSDRSDSLNGAGKGRRVVNDIKGVGGIQLTLEESVLPVIDLHRCDGCGKCTEACPVRALRVIEGKVQVVHTECDYCGECEAVCPTGAISCPYEIVWE